jgi:hypothetical protein
MLRTVREGLRLGLWLLFLGACIASLHALAGPFPVDRILEPGSLLETSLAAALRILGLGVGYWLALSTVLYLLASLSRVPAALHVTGWAAIPFVRRLVDRAVAGVLAASLSLPLAASAGVAPGYVPVPAGDESPAPPVPEPAPITTTTGSAASPPIRPPTTDPLFVPVGPEGSAATTPSTTDAGLSEVVVRPGDHMWKLAEDRLAAVLGRPVTDSEIAPYWLRVIGANLGTIRSGDPDLIFPGEVLVLPPIDVAPGETSDRG